MSNMTTSSTAPAGVPAFDPVPVRPRHDGWTPPKQIGFIAALTTTGCVTQAARHVGMSPRAAYDLYARRDAASFRAAWDAALRNVAAQLATTLLGPRAARGDAADLLQGRAGGRARRPRQPVGDVDARAARSVALRRVAGSACLPPRHSRRRRQQSAYDDERSRRRPRRRHGGSAAFGRATRPTIEFADDPAVAARTEREEEARATVRAAREEAAFQARLEAIARGDIAPGAPLAIAPSGGPHRRAAGRRAALLGGVGPSVAGAHAARRS